MADAFDHCERLVHEHDRGRFLATLFAPQKYRRPLYALYAFNIEIARIRELAREPMPGEIRLQWWREALLDARPDEASAHPVASAFREVAVRYRLPPAALGEMIDARSFDLYDEPMPSLAALETYAVRTAASVFALAGRIVCDGRDSRTDDLTAHAGIAYAVAGLLRALPIHAARRQLYLPADVMQRYGADPGGVFAARATTELRAVLAELRLHARRHLAAAGELVGAAPAAILPALLPAALVQPALRRMERRSYQPFARWNEAPWRQQWTLWRAARRPPRIFI